MPTSYQASTLQWPTMSTLQWTTMTKFHEWVSSLMANYQ
jgi:hypothetical protein